ncbi:MAG TPA: hypothetical protein VED67_01785 [Thermodesulfovibrionales bacterium]|nr:hypothetical protein [Thermodesulfovibrionales bacterium]
MPAKREWIIGIVAGIILIIGIAIHRLFFAFLALLIFYDAYIWWRDRGERFV